MKKITLVFALLLISCWQANAQFNESFEDDIPASWMVINQGDDNTWFAGEPNTGSAHTGTNVARIDYDASTAHDDYLITSQFVVTEGVSDRFSFWIKSRSNSFLESYEVLLSTTDNTSSDSFSVVLQAEETAPSTWTYEEFDLTDYAGQSVYVAIRATGLNEWELYVDDVVNDTPPTCTAPTDLIASNITATTADLAWTASDDETMWNIEIVEAGSEPMGTPTYTGVSNPFTAENLNSGTNHEFYVQADCGAGDLSAWAGPFEFFTECAIVDNFPSYTNFTENPPTICWTEAGSGEIADGPADDGISDWRDGTSYINAMEETINSNAINLYSTVDREWLISPEYDISTGGPYRLVVEVALTDYADTNSDVMGDDDEVKLLMTNDGGTTIIEVTTWNFDNQPSVNGTEFILDLDTYTGVVQFALWASDGTVDEGVDYDFHVGVFTVEEIPSCLEPTNLSVSNITTNTADVSWAAEGDETVWEILYGFEDFDFDSEGTTVIDIDGTIGETISGLSAENDYEFFVRADCGDGDFSTWAGPFEFSTAVAPVIVTSDAPVLDQAYCYESNDFKEWLFQSDDGSPISIEFFAGDLEMESDGSTFDDLMIYDGTDATGTVLYNSDVDGNELEEVFLIGTSGSIYMTLLSDPYVSCEEGDQISMDFDVEIYVAPTCPAPINVIASSSGTLDSVDLTWTETGEATEWEIVYGPTGFDIATEGITLTDNDGTLGHTITGLNTDTAYEFYVRAICAADDVSDWEDVEFFTGYCESVPTSNDGTGIELIEIGVNDFLSGGDITYEDFTGTTVDLPRAVEANVIVTFDHTYGYGTNIWIDFNNDLVFDDTELLIAGQSNDLDPNVADVSFMMPIDAPLGIHRMRIGTADYGQDTPNPCYNGSYGVTADFTVNITEAPSCLAPSNLHIITLSPTEVTFGWDAFEGATEYQYALVYAGVDPDEGTIINSEEFTTGNEVTISDLTANLDYEIYVKSLCDDSSESFWTSISFFTGYCESIPTSVDGGIGITVVEIGNTEFTSTEATYDDFTDTPVDLAQGIDSNVQLTIDTGFGYGYGVNIWIDLNDNLEFEETELMFSGETDGAPLTTLNASFTMPIDAPLGTHGMRLATADSGQNTPNPCYSGSYGATADFTVNITEAPDCMPVTNVVLSNLTADAVTVTWNGNVNATEYEWIVIFAGLDPETAAPFAEGTTTATTVDISGLQGATEYEVFVRANCGTDGYSPWSIGVSFLTFCDPVTEFAEYFDDVTTPALPVCWDNVLDNGVTEYATVDTVDDEAFSGTNSVEMYNSGSPVASNIMLVSPMVSNLDAGTHWFRFYAKHGTTNQDVEVGTMSDPGDGSTFTPFELVDITAEWTEYHVDFSTYTGTDNFIVVRRLSTSTYTYVYIDNATWEEVPTCIYPTGVVVNSTTVDGANISWDENLDAIDGYTWVVVPQGGDPDLDGVATGDSATNMADITGLDSDTAYEVYVAANCGTNGISDWSIPATFSTTCFPATIPFFEGFEVGYVHNTAVDGCWEQQSISSDQQWTANNTYTDYNRTPRTGDWNMFLRYGNEDWMFIAVQLEAGEVYQLEFFARQDGDGASNASVAASIGTSASASGMTDVIVSETGVVNGDYQQMIGYYEAPTTGVYYLGIYGEINFSPWYISVDDISFDIAPTCLPPSNVEVTETLANGAEVTWDPIDNATNGYEWVVVLDGGDPTVSDDIIASGTSMTNSATIEGEGIESGVDYEVYVSTNCGDVDGESSFSQGVAFTTACVAPTGLTVDEIGLDEVTFSWDAMEASLGYEYIIVLTGEEPIEENYVAIGALGSSSQTSITVEFESYGPNVTFDIYFRIVCDTAFYGEWGMVSFTTPGTTAVGENTIEGFSYYPNPVKEQGLNLMAPQNIDAVIIYNMLGQEVLNLKPNAKNYNVEMSNLQAGTYILKVTVGSTTGTYGIIKE